MIQHNSGMTGKSQKQGMAPGTVMYTGERKLEQVSLYQYRYQAESLQEQTLEPDHIALPAPGEKLWINIEGLHDTTLIEHLGDAFNLHPLTQEDIASIHQRPKLELYDSYIYVVLRMIYIDKTGSIANEQLSLVLGENFVLSFQEIHGDVFDPIRKRLQNSQSRLRNLGSDFLFYALIDVLVDAYFGVLENIGDQLEDLEEEIIEANSKQIMTQLRTLRHELLVLRKGIWPVRDVINAMMRDAPGLLSKDVQLYLRDVHDHGVQATDGLESLRELQASLHDFYLSQLSYRMNEVMKVLTIISTIFIPLSFLVGVYGMNFDHMPELHWLFSYPGLWFIMISIAIGMLIYFWRKDWF
ncbi:MAG: magnesium/cobalt transporter CorA [Trueperaceae bacterium]|nr:magnesium/cobalt transporter CorA [Trueperaceae bacterium]